MTQRRIGQVTLILDATGSSSAAAVAIDGTEISRVSAGQRDGSERDSLIGVVASVFVERDILPHSVARVVVVSGGGSATGIRVITSFGKGLASATGAVFESLDVIGLVLGTVDGRSHQDVILPGRRAPVAGSFDADGHPSFRVLEDMEGDDRRLADAVWTREASETWTALRDRVLPAHVLDVYLTELALKCVR